MSKYKQLISEARKQDAKKVGKAGDGVASEPDVNLSIKVAVARRRHWAAEAKRQGTTLTAAITDALSTRFGEPK